MGCYEKDPLDGKWEMTYYAYYNEDFNYFQMRNILMKNNFSDIVWGTDEISDINNTNFISFSFGNDNENLNYTHGTVNKNSILIRMMNSYENDRKELHKYKYDLEKSMDFLVNIVIDEFNAYPTEMEFKEVHYDIP